MQASVKTPSPVVDLVQDSDEFWMREALKEAARGEGGTRPNPPVGCLIVKDGQVIGRGHHQFAGGPHAEVSAIASLKGADVMGATLYVTLEPCCTYGRTPPCTDAIIQSGIKRVVVALSDVNPKHAGRGLNLLWKADVDVVTEVCWRDARRMLEPFFKYVTQKRPYVTLKMAQSLDGGIADHAGQSKWITCVEAREHVRQLRQKADLVLVGSGTVLADDSSLLRGAPVAGYQGLPGMRGVLDSSGKVPLTAKIFTDGHAEKTLYFTTEACSEAYQNAVKQTGAKVVVLPAEFPASSGSPVISLEALLCELGEMCYMNVLCEGGAKLASSFINAGLVDELLLFIAPVVLGRSSKRVFGQFPFDLPTAPRFSIDTVDRFGTDLLVRALPQKGS